MSPLAEQQEISLVDSLHDPMAQAVARSRAAAQTTWEDALQQAVFVSNHVAAIRAQTECAQLYLEEAKHNLRTRPMPPPVL